MTDDFVPKYVGHRKPKEGQAMRKTSSQVIMKRKYYTYESALRARFILRARDSHLMRIRSGKKVGESQSNRLVRKYEIYKKDGYYRVGKRY